MNARRRLAALLVALCGTFPLAANAALTAASAPAPALAASMPSGETSPISEASAEALWRGDFDLLEQQYDAVRSSPDIVDGGALRLQWFRVGLARVFNAEDEHDPYFAQLEALTHDWTVAHPRSPLAQLLYARALYARALDLRGTDYVSKTPAAAMQQFEHYLGLAEGQLAEHADVLRNESTTYVYQAMFGRWHLPFDRVHAIVLDGLKTNRRDLGGYEELAMAALPRYGGSTELFDAVVREAIRRIDGYDGMALYAFLYDDDAGMFDGALFSDSDVDWPTMRQGFRDYLARYPDAYLLNRFALQACLAEDKPTTLELLEQIGAKPSQRAWGKRFDTCRHWARSP